MAFLELEFFSKMLSRRTELGVILPERKAVQDRYPVLWLLHGATGDYTDWWRNSAVELYAEQYGIAVVTASGDNAFYSNCPLGRYFDYFTKELPDFLGGLLPIDGRREKNLVAGLSMGGHGAYKLALSAPDRYLGAAVLSAGNFLDLGDSPEGHPFAQIHRAVFGTAHLADLRGTEHDICHLGQLAAEQGSWKPEFFVCCGTEDGAYDSAKKTFEFLTAELGFAGEWRQSPGVHDWFFWNGMLPEVMGWCARLLRLE